jgi:hypothetical protein
MAKILEEKGICTAAGYLEFVSRPEFFSISG